MIDDIETNNTQDYVAIVAKGRIHSGEISEHFSSRSIAWSDPLVFSIFFLQSEIERKNRLLF